MGSEYSRVRAEVFLRGVWWGACDGTKPGNPLVAEAGNVLERRHGINVLVRAWHGIFVGGSVRRRAVHHFWRNGRPYPWGQFPLSGRAKTAQERCQQGQPCPALGYHDHVRPMIVYDWRGVSVEVLGPGYRWKDVTLPYASYMGSVSYTGDTWGVDVKGAAGGLREPVLDGGVRVRIIQSMWAQVRFGTLHAPGWRGPLYRLAVGLELSF